MNIKENGNSNSVVEFVEFVDPIVLQFPDNGNGLIIEQEGLGCLFSCVGGTSMYQIKLETNFYKMLPHWIKAFRGSYFAHT